MLRNRSGALPLHNVGLTIAIKKVDLVSIQF